MLAYIIDKFQEDFLNHPVKEFKVLEWDSTK